MEIKSWLKNIGVGIVKNGCDHSSLRTLKLTVSQVGIIGINWFLVCWQKFRNTKSYNNNFWMVVIKNRLDLLGLRTLKSARMKLWIGLIFCMLIQILFMKAKSYFNNYWVGVDKNQWSLKYHETLKPGVSHKWFDELSRLIEWFLHADNDEIIFYSTLSF